ncbi:hypothetical protein DENSPDRAFT_73514 [Dentipellis sp. KUC8613]|nr:hypothetical protein DENSPDRAFT_73514 [Dentipellis sp. KUC8613]
MDPSAPHHQTPLTEGEYFASRQAPPGIRCPRARHPPECTSIRRRIFGVPSACSRPAIQLHGLHLLTRSSAPGSSRRTDSTARRVPQPWLNDMNVAWPSCRGFGASEFSVVLNLQPIDPIR